MRPEHTMEAYELAAQQGADIIECDVAVTKDLKLICTHDAWLNDTTDVHNHPEFSDRVRTYWVPARASNITDYFTIDFTLEELMTLRKIQDRTYRDQSYNGQFSLATFDQYVEVAKRYSDETKSIGIYPEAKTPDFFNNNLDRTMEDIMVESLHFHGYNKSDSPCFVQSFSIDSLRAFSKSTKLPLVYLMSTSITDNQLEEYASFVTGIGPSKSAIIRVNSATNKIIGATDFMQRVKKYNYVVHPYTFRNEYQFLAYDYGADPYREYEEFIAQGVDGLFTDFPWSFHNYLTHGYANGGATNSFSMVLYFLSLSYIYFFSI